MAYIFAMNPRNRVRELRKRHGISQAQLAEAIGVSQPAISQIENDTRPLTIDYMRTFARIFRCAPADLLTEDDNPDRLSDAERALIQQFRQSSDDHRAMIRRVAEPIAEYRQESAEPLRKQG